MIPAEQLAQTFKSNHWLACRLLEGIRHEESLLTPHFQANCMNWVLGHILVGRDRALKALEKPLVFGETETDLYKTGSEPITNTSALPLEKLHTLLDETQRERYFKVTTQPTRGLARKKGVRGGVYPHAHLFFGKHSLLA
ncbi:MAG TPA: hypothetical protein VI451_01040 [Anaerolineales bacterium]|nr:hypothetical protein [Anaerolineales bacterium]